jgi:hypothetical protein
MTTQKINHPATKAFVSALLTECAKQGLAVVSLDPSTESGLKENGGWCFLRLEGTHEAGASLIIPKAVGRLGRLHSHVDLVGHDGHVALPKKNGKVICHFEPDLAKVSKVLKFFLSASKRATLAPTPKATVSAPAVAPTADSQPTVTLASPEPVEIPADAWHALSGLDASEDEAETVSATA